MSPDPWAVAIEAGAQLVSALAAAGNDESVAHPWIEQGPTPGARSLRLPLPPPEVIRGLADALSALADSRAAARLVRDRSMPLENPGWGIHSDSGCPEIIWVKLIGTHAQYDLSIWRA